MLNPSSLKISLDILSFQPDIDIFVSWRNHQFPQHCSYLPDPGALFIDGFSISWSGHNFCCFPPFSCILKALQKMRQESSTGIMVVPNWPTQSSYPIMTSMLFRPPVRLPPSPTLLSSPVFPGQMHPQHKKLKILVCLLSGKTYLLKVFLLLLVT